MVCYLRRTAARSDTAGPEPAGSESAMPLVDARIIPGTNPAGRVRARPQSAPPACGVKSALAARLRDTAMTAPAGYGSNLTDPASHKDRPDALDP